MNKKVYSESPYIATYDNYITIEECEHFINISKDSLKRALVSSNEKGYVSNGRTGSNTWVPHDYDEITKKVGERIAKLVDMPLENAESFQVIHYSKTQEYRNHYDSWSHDGSEKTLRCMKWGGARLKTALCYLNDVEKGGGTKMTKLNITVEPKKGRLLIFHNTMMDETGSHDKHPLSEHAGTPVIEGEKYAFNLWFKECNNKKLYSEYNPNYYITEDTNDIDDNSIQLYCEESIKISKELYYIESFLNKKCIKNLLSLCNFTQNKRRNGWVKLDSVKEISNKIEEIINIDNIFFENINIIEYKPKERHGKHFEAFDVTTEKGKKYTKNRGQRLHTITIILSNNIQIIYPNINVNQIFSEGDCLICNNVLNNNRHPKLEKIIENNASSNGYIANLYVREFK